VNHVTAGYGQLASGYWPATAIGAFLVRCGSRSADTPASYC
jgi:hypothetical protein